MVFRCDGGDLGVWRVVPVMLSWCRLIGDTRIVQRDIELGYAGQNDEQLAALL